MTVWRSLSRTSWTSRPIFTPTAYTCHRATGQLEQWRIVNASPTRFFLLTVDGHPLHLIGSDGGRLDRPRQLDRLLVTPGERAEVLLTPATPGSVRIRALLYDRGKAGMGMISGNSSSDELTLATMNIAGDTTTPAVLPARLADPTTFELPEPTASRTLTLGMSMGGGMMRGGSMMSFSIDGRPFDPERIDIATGLGQVEEWTIRNDTPMDHPFRPTRQ